MWDIRVLKLKTWLKLEINNITVNIEQSSETDAVLLTNEEAIMEATERNETAGDVEDIGKCPRFFNNKIHEHIIETAFVSMKHKEWNISKMHMVED